MSDPADTAGPRPRVTPEAAPTPAGESTVSLLQRAQAGDQEALEVLMARYVPRMTRWASGRLPRWARDIAETSDLVQETLLKTLKHLDRFDVRGEGAFQAYLRQAIANRIAEEFRRHARRADSTTLDGNHADLVLRACVHLSHASASDKAIDVDFPEFFAGPIWHAKIITDNERQAVYNLHNKLSIEPEII